MSNIIRCFVHPNDSRNHCAGSSLYPCILPKAFDLHVWYKLMSRVVRRGTDITLLFYKIYEIQCVEYSVLHEKTNISLLPKSARGHRALPEKILDVTFFLGF